MSGGIEEPYTVAQLPRPIEDGNILAAPVCSFSGSRKRKRHEVAVAVDGECVNLYNIQDQSTVTSYPLPPQSYLAAPPCSVFCKRSKTSRSARHTYVALRDSSRQAKLRLVSFQEEQGRLRTELKEPQLPVKKEYQLRHGDLAGIDVLCASSTTSEQQPEYSVLVVYKNGYVECLSQDLATRRWHETRSVTEDEEVEYAAIVDFDTARKGLLKEREDIYALLRSSDTELHTGYTSALLFQIVRSGPQRTVHIYALRDVTGPSLQGARPHMEEVLSYELARRNGQSTRATYELHPGSGLLYQHLEQRLTVFDLSGIVPKNVFELGKKAVPRVKSFARLSSATLVAVLDDKVAVYDTKYRSILSFFDLPAKKSETLSIVSHFTDLSIIVALFQGSVVAMQIGDISDDGRRVKSQGPLLIEVMGKNKFTETKEAEYLTKRKEHQRQKWESWKSEVDQLVRQQAVTGLEERVAKDLNLDHSRAAAQTNGHLESRVNLDDQAEIQSSLWKLSPRAYDPQQVETKKAIYLLGRIFKWSAPQSAALGGSCKLQLSLVSRSILRWLAMAGFLTTTEIEHALPRSVEGTEVRPRIAPGDIISAIQEADPSFTLLCDLVSLPIHLEMAEVVTGLQRLIWSLQDKDRAETVDVDIDMISKIEDEESRILSETAKADQQLEIANRLLESGLVERSQACRILLARLQAFPQKDVAVMMHKMLSYEELYFLISILRVELFDGNWALQYIENTDDEVVVPGELGAAQEIRLSNQAIRSIARLFSCAIDAVGMTGWLVGLSADTIGAHEIIQSLRNEIAAATEGLYDASYIEVLLGEVGKTAGSMEERNKQEGNFGRRKRKYQEEGSIDAESRLMPLGSRVRSVRGTKIGKHVKPAVLAEERSRAVGKYAYERIRI